VKVNSEKASIWSNRFVAKITSFILRATSFLLPVEIVSNFQGLAPRHRAFIVGQAFYRPFLRFGRAGLWGLKFIRIRDSSVEVSTYKILPKSAVSQDRMPAGPFLAQVLPETEFSIKRIGKEDFNSPPRMVSIGREGAPLLGIVEPTKSYFHFVAELLPIVLKYSSDWRVAVPVFHDWQIEALLAFSFGYSIEPISERESIKTVLKRSLWGVYPASQPLLRANEHLLSLPNLPDLWRGTDELFLLRTNSSSTTGRLPGSSIRSFFDARSATSVIEPASMPVAQQFSAFRHARVVAGTHGSAFASLVASAPGTQVIEIDGPEIFHFHIRRICEILGFDHVFVRAKTHASGLQVERGVLEESLGESKTTY
jgi:hypothetical protein